tara:strand:- start:683 stop:1060 length:378 start_codon:yes stop_codon:yes gene_type:complete
MAEIQSLFYSNLPQDVIYNIYEKLCNTKKISTTLKADLVTYFYLEKIIKIYKVHYPFYPNDAEYMLYTDICKTLKIRDKVVFNINNVKTELKKLWASISPNNRNFFIRQPLPYKYQYGAHFYHII